jgi:hypothetical protein
VGRVRDRADILLPVVGMRIVGVCGMSGDL